MKLLEDFRAAVRRRRELTPGCWAVARMAGARGGGACRAAVPGSP